MKLLSLRLRGAIGIYDGLGIDEVNIDFTKFEPGTICVYGDNGAGKTTLIENLTPFRKLFSRPGGLANQFRLKDSCRDLWIELGPDQYRFLININADSGKIESYVYRNGEVMNADGKEGSYNDIVYGLFGSPELFSSSLFMPQKRTPFSKLSPERREELFNLEDIQAKSKHAADQAKDLQAKISELSGRIGQLDDSIKSMAGIEESINIGAQLVEVREKSIAGIKLQIETLTSDLTALQEKAKAQAALKSELAAIDRAIQQLQIDKTNVGYEHEQKLSKLETEIGVTTTAVETQEKLLDPEKLERMRELVTKRAELAAEIERHVQEYGEHVQAKTELSTAKSDAALAVAKLSPRVGQAEQFVASAKQSAQLIQEVPCQKLADEEERKRCSSCKFLLGAVTARDSLFQYESELRTVRDEQAKEINLAEARIQSAADYLAESIFDETRAKACKAELAAIDAQKPVEYIQRAEVAETKRAGLREKLAGLKEQHQTIAEDKLTKVRAVVDLVEGKVVERTAIAAGIDATIDQAITDKSREIERARLEERADRDQLAAAKKDIEALTEKLQQREESQARLGNLTTELAELESSQADWLHLSQMLSRNGGFQSYLIETSAVEMTEFANELLKGYDVPWTLEIATSTKTADGKKDKDGFFVFVNTPTGQRELGDLSGGQAVWVDTILQHAVAYVQQRLSGKKLLTKILDEADGALDEERAIAYLNAITAAHEQSGLWHTILISHRPEIQNMISQRIHFSRGKGIEIERD